MCRSIAALGCIACHLAVLTSVEAADAQRGFQMGFVPIPAQPVTTETWLDTFSLIGQNAEFVLHHSTPDWSAFSQGTGAPPSCETPGLECAEFIIGMSRLYGRAVLLVIDPLCPNREEIDADLPPDWQRSFADANVRQAFKNYAIRMAGDYKPEYVTLGSEVNTYMSHHPEDAANLESLIRETIPLVRAQSPDSRITVSFQLEALSGLADGLPHWDLLSALEPVLDVVAVGTYPSGWFASPSDLSDDYYACLKQYTSKPIIIAESGWPSGGEAEYHGSTANQEAFLNRAVELTQGINLKLWIWWFPNDWSCEGYEEVFGTMGLRTSDGTPKPAWTAWQQIHNMTLAAVPAAPADFDHDGNVNDEDLAHLLHCVTGARITQNDPACLDADLDHDGDVDQEDFAILQRCKSGPDTPADPNCAN